MLHPSQPVFTFAKEGIDTTEKWDDLDLRKPLDLNFNQVEKRIPEAHILPEHKPPASPDLGEAKRGPGRYDVNFDLVERRMDIGNVEYQPITDKNARENIVDLANKEAADVDYDPNYDPVKPRQPMMAIMKQPTDRKISPIHITS